MHRMDRRGATRYRLNLAVAFSWRDEKGILQGGEGQSRDINGRGIYIYSHQKPPVASYVEMNILLPQAMPPKRLAELHAKGRVVRIDSSETPSQASGFATMNHTMALRDADGNEIDRQHSWKDFGFGE
jgi:hypothetical protein